MSNPEQQLKDFLNRLVAQTTKLDSQIKIYRYIGECVNDDRREALNIAPGFFRTVQDAFVANIIVLVNKLFDDRKDAKRCVQHFLTLAKENYPTIQKALEYISVADIDQQITEIDNLKPILCKVKTQRDTYYAHHDVKYFDNPKDLQEAVPIDSDEIQKVSEVLQEILQRHYLALFQVHRFKGALNGLDIEDAIASIFRYNRMKNDSRVSEAVREHPEYMKY